MCPSQIQNRSLMEKKVEECLRRYKIRAKLLEVVGRFKFVMLPNLSRRRNRVFVAVQFD